MEYRVIYAVLKKDLVFYLWNHCSFEFHLISKLLYLLCGSLGSENVVVTWQKVWGIWLMVYISQNSGLLTDHFFRLWWCIALHFITIRVALPYG